MRKHSMFRSGNPALNSQVFKNLKRTSNGPLVRDDVMTIQGTVDKTGISLALLMFAGYFAYVPNGLLYMIIGGVGGFIVALITIFKKTWSPITVPLYAMFEGLLLGSISYVYDNCILVSPGNINIWKLGPATAEPVVVVGVPRSGNDAILTEYSVSSK